MSEIPEDVLKAARRVAGEWNLIDAIAKEILSERERCAKIAYEYECRLADYGGSVDAEHFYEGGMLDAGTGIAAAIRSYPDPGKGG